MKKCKLKWAALGGVFLIAIGFPILVQANPPKGGAETKPSLAAPADKAQLLFVQSAEGVSFDQGKMTLKGVSPVTVYFSDRPQRIAGHLATTEMIPLWDEGKDSFLHDPPNATLSVFNETTDKITNLVVELSKPALNGRDLSYNIRVLQGTPPTKDGLCSLFIDVIGMPLTPVSYAGAARRRAVIWR